MNTIAFDLDGTLFCVRPPVYYDDPESVRTRTCPNKQVCELARQIGENARLAIVTGRTRQAGMKVVTRGQLRGADLQPDQLHLQPFWDGYGSMRRWKAKVLEHLDADVYVGDHDMDEAAAEDAGTAFIHASTFQHLAGVSRETWTRGIDHLTELATASEPIANGGSA